MGRYSYRCPQAARGHRADTRQRTAPSTAPGYQARHPAPVHHGWTRALPLKTHRAATPPNHSADARDPEAHSARIIAAQNGPSVGTS